MFWLPIQLARAHSLGTAHFIFLEKSLTEFFSILALFGLAFVRAHQLIWTKHLRQIVYSPYVVCSYAKNIHILGILFR